MLGGLRIQRGHFTRHRLPTLCPLQPTLSTHASFAADIFIRVWLPPQVESRVEQGFEATFLVERAVQSANGWWLDVGFFGSEDYNWAIYARRYLFPAKQPANKRAYYMCVVIVNVICLT